MDIVLETPRLRLRPFELSDLDALAAMNSDERVMRFFPALQDRLHSKALIERWQERWAEVGYAFSAVESKASGQVIGMAGLSRFEADVAFAPCTEIGWRFVPEAWGQGFASEAAGEWLRYAFEELDIPRVYAFAPRLNQPSIAVMTRIGMRRSTDLDFEHPLIPKGHDLRPMSVCSITQSDWLRQRRDQAD